MASSAASLVVSDVPVDVDDEPEDGLEDEPVGLLSEWLPARLPARLPACPSALSPVDVLNTQYPERPGGEPLPPPPSLEAFTQAWRARGMADFTVPGPRVLVDTTDFSTVDYGAIARQVGEALRQLGEKA